MACGSRGRKRDEKLWAVTPAEKEEDKRISVQLRNDRQALMELLSWIVLGLPGSGKSTFMTQLVRIYGKGFPEDERKAFPPPDVVLWMRTLCSQLEATLKLTLTPGSVAQAAELVCSLPGTTALDEKVGSAIATLWRDEIVRRAWEQRSQFSEAIPDGAAYFFDKVAEIARPGYIPNDTDPLHLPWISQHVRNVEFIIDGNKFEAVDMGRNKGCRRKWLPMCEVEAHSLIYVVDLSSYDHAVTASEGSGSFAPSYQLAEALQDFEEVVNSRWFHRANHFLLLNKRELFAKKIKRSPLPLYLPELDNGSMAQTEAAVEALGSLQIFPPPLVQLVSGYALECNPKLQEYEAAVAAIQQAFERRCKRDERLYCYGVSLTDTNNVMHVVNALKDMCIRNNLTAPLI